MANIDLVKINKSFTGKKGTFSIKDLDLSVPDGKTMVILGPSGCGKTTLLRLIAGLDRPDSGEVRFNGVNVNGLEPKDRKLGMVFQNYALFPHMTARKNMLTYFLFKRKTPQLDREAEEKFRKTSELLGVEIGYLLDREPKKLSGGEKQRVAIGRCITRNPSLFLLDEPFSALDAQLRETYRVQLKRLLSLFRVTTVYITHDQQEALVLADLIAVMRSGAIEQVGSYEEIYRSPASLFVAEFLNPHTETQALNRLDGRIFGKPGLVAGVRPQEVIVTGNPGEGILKGSVQFASPMPVRKITILNVLTQEGEITAPVPIEDRYQPGQEVGLRFGEYFLFDAAAGKRIDTGSK